MAITVTLGERVNGTLKLTHFAFCRHLQSDPPVIVSFVFAGRAMMPARRLSFSR